MHTCMSPGHPQGQTVLLLMHMSMVAEDVGPGASQGPLSCASGVTHDCQIAYHIKQMNFYTGNTDNAKARLVFTK